MTLKELNEKAKELGLAENVELALHLSINDAWVIQNPRYVYISQLGKFTGYLVIAGDL